MSITLTGALISPPGGEINTASNVGAGGEGLFKQKNGADLEFKNINAASERVVVTQDGGNDEIDIDVDETKLNLDGGTY